MDKPRECGCKGCRTCLVCEKKNNITPKSLNLSKENKSYVYCPFCNKAWTGWNVDEYKNHPNHSGLPIDYPGIYIQLNFLNEMDEDNLLNGIEKIPWDLSQSGRRKQNFGPKCNFKKNKLALGNFNGFPKFTEFIQKKFNNVSYLKGFHTIEQCSLEYDPVRGASIDPHIDDCWIWGERIVTVNLLSDSVLTMTTNKKINNYNLHLVKKYPLVLDENGKLNSSNKCFEPNINTHDYIVRIPMPRRSLLIMFGAARYEWEHQILREDIKVRRICLAYREFTPLYLPNGEKYNEGSIILQKAKLFF